MEKDILDLNRNSETPADSVEDVIARGAAAATNAEPATATVTDSGLEISDAPKRRKYTRRNSRKPAEPTPEELQEQQAAAELEAFFAPEGIGKVFTTMLDAFYTSCGAPALVEAESEMLARVFSQWAKFRLPARASQYQPDILLVSMVGMVTLPRIKPIAEKTAPWWRRMWDKMPWRRAKFGGAPSV